MGKNAEPWVLRILSIHPKTVKIKHVKKKRRVLRKKMEEGRWEEEEEKEEKEQEEVAASAFFLMQWNLRSCYVLKYGKSFPFLNLTFCLYKI